jgi:hypothetical protein
MSAPFNLVPGDTLNSRDASSLALRGQGTVVSLTYTNSPTNTAGFYVIENMTGVWAAGDQLISAGKTASISTVATVVGYSVFYKHEVGYGYIDLVGEAPGLPFIRSGPVQLAEGEQFVTADRMMYDIEAKPQAVEFALDFWSAPNGHLMKSLPYIACSNVRGYSDFRGVGRSVIITFRGIAGNTDFWRMGTMRFHTQPGEGR